MGNQALESLEIGNSKTVRTRRLLLISNLGDSSLNRKNSTRNRKTKLACESFEHEGVHYKVNSKKSGIYKEIMFKIIEQMKIAREIHNRLLVVRFDLHSGNFSQGSFTSHLSLISFNSLLGCLILSPSMNMAKW